MNVRYESGENPGKTRNIVTDTPYRTHLAPYVVGARVSGSGGRRYAESGEGAGDAAAGGGAVAGTRCWLNPSAQTIMTCCELGGAAALASLWLTAKRERRPTHEPYSFRHVLVGSAEADVPAFGALVHKLISIVGAVDRRARSPRAQELCRPTRALSLVPPALEPAALPMALGSATRATLKCCTPALPRDHADAPQTPAQIAHSAAPRPRFGARITPAALERNAR